ncbi:MAG: HEAT repeat domain-containing protein [Thermodesulfobacteriota bacterium]|nr:HEAT repeat domain-containing protein [Thermodesulfobacteriota bacterium]
MRGFSRRALKEKTLNLLKLSDLDRMLDEFSKLPPPRVITPLFSFLYSEDEEIRWKAVTAIGFVVSHIASKEMESARTEMRRLMWNLNEESGGIGWGAPEAMGEIMACHEGLANEYAHILVSYIREDGNFLDNRLLQQGVIWGLGRVAQVRPHILMKKGACPYLRPFLRSADPTSRALSAWTLGLLGDIKSKAEIEGLLNDDTKVLLYIERQLLVKRVKDVVEEALKLINNRIC